MPWGYSLTSTDVLLKSTDHVFFKFIYSREARNFVWVQATDVLFHKERNTMAISFEHIWFTDSLSLCIFSSLSHHRWHPASWWYLCGESVGRRSQPPCSKSPPQSPAPRSLTLPALRHSIPLLQKKELFSNCLDRNTGKTWPVVIWSRNRNQVWPDA